MGRSIWLRDRELASSSIIVWLATMFLWWTGGNQCPSDLVLKTGGSITFDSRTGVSSLVQVWFWAFFDVHSMDWRLRGGGSCIIFRERVLDVARYW